MRIDHILCRKSESSRNIDCFVDPTAECWTDHHMIILKYRLLPQHKFKQMGKSRLSNKSDHASTNDRRIFPAKLIPENSQIRADLGTAIDTRLKLESILPSVINCSPKDTMPSQRQYMKHAPKS